MPNVSVQDSKGLSTNILPLEGLEGNTLTTQTVVNTVESAVSKGLQELEKTLLERIKQGAKNIPLKIGGVEVPLSIERAEPLWNVRLAAGKPVPLPSLVDLMDTAGGTANGLPANLARFTEVALSDVQARYDDTVQRLTLVSFVVTSRSPWSLSALPGVSVENLRVELEVRAPTSKPLLTVALTGSLRIGKLTFPIQASLEEGRWRFHTPTVQETAQTLRQLIQQLLLEGVTLPEGLLDLPLSGLRLSADLDQPRLTLSSTATGHASLGAMSFESRGFEVRFWSLPDPTGPHRSLLAWHVALEGGLKLANALNVDGRLVLSRTAADTGGLVFEPRQADVTLPLPIPKHSAAVTFSLGRTSLTHTAQGWALESSASVAFSGMPPFLQKVLPERTTGAVKATEKRATLTVDRLFRTVELQIPDIRVDGKTVASLGTVILDAMNFSLELDKDPSFAVTLALGLPSKLNNLFGTKSDGSPRLELFRTSPELLELELSASAEGVKLSPRTSPLKDLSFEQADGASWAWLRLGDIGEARLKVPEFRYDAATGSLRASGAFEMTKPLRVPLSIIKNALTAAKHPEIASLLPDHLPLTEFKPLGADGRLDAGLLASRLEQLFGGPLPQAVREVLRVVAERINDLPDRFRSYLSIELLDKLFFDISVTPDGGAKIDVKAPGDKPLRMLIPWPNDAFRMIGVELRGLSFGETFSGAFFLLQVDARVDLFDLVTLTAALTGVHQKVGLPPSTSFQTTFILDDLFMLIFYHAGVPIPIPLFFDELGMVYAGIEGARFETHVRLPMPRANALEGLQLGQELLRFFKERDYLLDTGTSLESMKLQLSVGPNYLQLPPYLGGKVLGSKDAVVTVDLFNKAATVLNTFKTGNVADLMTVVPLEHRVGRESVKLGPLEAEMAWLLTTPAEFRALSHERLAVSKTDSAEVLSVVPAEGPQSEKGLVALMKGHGKLGDLEVDSVVLGLSTTASMGLRTGFRTVGSVAGLGRLELAGSVAVPRSSQPEAGDASGPIQLSGRLALLLPDGVPIFDGQVSREGEELSVQGKLDLFPRSPRLRVTGQLAGRIGPRELNVSGSASLSLGGAFTLANASAELTRDRLRVLGSWRGQTVSFAARKVDSGLQLEASLAAPVSVGDVLRITDTTAKAGPSALLTVGGDGAPHVALDGAVHLLGISQATRVDLSEQGVQFEASGKLFNHFEATVKVRGGNLDNGDALNVQGTLRADLGAFLKEHASRAIQTVTDGATRELNNALREVDKAQAEVNRLNWEINHMRETIQAERNRDQQRLAAAQEEVRKAQAEVNRLNGEIQRVRAIIDGERQSVQRQLQKARADLDAAQREVNRINGELESTKRWYNSLPKVAPPNKPSQLREAAVYAAKMGALNGAREVANTALHVCRKALEAAERAVRLPPPEADFRLAGLLAAREVASKALAVAQEALAAIRKGIQEFPIDGDPRLAGLFAAREVASKALAVAQEVLAAIRKGIQEFPIDGDPRMVGLFAGRDVATAALKLAHQAIEKLKAALGELAEVGTYITQRGLGSLLDVRSASFETNLNVARGARITLDAEVVYTGRTRHVSFELDFNNPLAGANALARALLPAAR